MAAPNDWRRIRWTQEWRRLAKKVCQEEPICWLQLACCTTRSTTGDHVIPVAARPDLALVRSNVRGACRPCNNKRGHLPPDVARQMYGTATRGAPTPAKPRALGIFDT